MAFPINSFDGYQLGSFDETDKQQTDTYSSNRIDTWYGWLDEYLNDRTAFVVSRDISFLTLKQAIIARLNSLNTGDHFQKRPASINENEYIMPIRGWERMDLNHNMIGNVNMEVGNRQYLMSAVNELSIVTTINRYAYQSPPELKLQAAVEFATWLIRQPVGSNKANGIVRSGAATLLDAYKYRGL